MNTGVSFGGKKRKNAFLGGKKSFFNQIFNQLIVYICGHLHAFMIRGSDHTVADPEGGSWGSNELPLEPKLFHFYGEFQEKLVEPHKSTPHPPPPAYLNPLSKNPGSGPGSSIYNR